MTTSLPLTAPDLDEPLTLQSWGAYREILEEWCEDWDKQDALLSSLKPDELRSSESLPYHPEYQGKTYDQILQDLRKEARYVQVEYKLYAKYLKPGTVVSPDNEDLRSRLKYVMDWSLFGGPDWYYLSPDDLVQLMKSWSVDNFAYLLEVPHDVIARNRFAYALYENSVYERGGEPSMPDFLRFYRAMRESTNKPSLGQRLRGLGRKRSTFGQA